MRWGQSSKLRIVILNGFLIATTILLCLYKSASYTWSQDAMRCIWSWTERLMAFNHGASVMVQLSRIIVHQQEHPRRARNKTTKNTCNAKDGYNTSRLLFWLTLWERCYSFALVLTVVQGEKWRSIEERKFEFKRLRFTPHKHELQLIDFETWTFRPLLVDSSSVIKRAAACDNHATTITVGRWMRLSFSLFFIPSSYHSSSADDTS